MERRLLRHALSTAASLALIAVWAAPAFAQRSRPSPVPVVRAASVAEASLVPGGASVSVTLRGDGLASLTDAFVASRGRPVGDTKAALARTRSRTSRSVELAAGARAPTGTWELRLAYRDARGRTRTVVAPVRVVVRAAAPRTPPSARRGAPAPRGAPALRVAPAPRPALSALTVSRPSLRTGETAVVTVTLDRAAPGGGTTLRVASDPASAVDPAARTVTVPAGRSTASWEITAGSVEASTNVELTAELDRSRRTAGLVVEPPAFEAVALTTDALRLTGRRFAPVALTTNPLRLTGRRFAPVALTTSPLQLTGRRFAPVALTTSPLRLTGRRFVPLEIQTQTLRLTGRGEENQ